MSGLEGAIQAACAIHPDRQAVTTCMRCGTFACEECLSESPSGETLCSACVARAETSQLPWDYREDLGWVKAWFKSLGPLLLRPGATFATARPDGDVGGSILFTIVAWFITFFPTFMIFAAFGAMLPSFMGDGNKSDVPIGAILAGSYGLMALIMPIFGLVFTILMTGLEHLVMMMLGKPRGFDTTLRGAALSMAPYILGVIPICGLYIAPFWSLVLKVFAYKALHRTTTGVAVAGALGVFALGVVLTCGLYGAMLFAVAAAGGR
jgi:hypothetical protein